MILWENKQALQELLTKVSTSSHSDFYKKKFSSLHNNIESSLEELPFLSRTELVETPPDKRLYTPANDVSFIGYTSGTTSGKPLISYFFSIDNYFFEPSLGMPVTRLLITYPPLNKNFGHSFIQQCRQAKNKVTPVFADYQNLTNSAIIGKETGIDAIYATPTIAIKLGEQIGLHCDPKQIKLLALSSETLTSTQRKALETLYPNANVANLYASSEIGQFILYPCKSIINSGKNEFHFLSEALVGLELIDNELVVTYGLNKAFPLIRYRTGDYFEIARESCDCGIAGKTLKWSGRMDVDKLRIHGFEIKAEEVDEVFYAISPLLNDYQVHFYKGRVHPEIINIVVEIKRQDDQRLRDNSIMVIIQRELLKNWKVAPNTSLAQAIERDIFSGLDIIFVNEFTLQSQKNRRLISHID